MEFLSKMIIKERRLQNFYGNSSQGIPSLVNNHSNSNAIGRMTNSSNTLSIAPMNNNNTAPHSTNTSTNSGQFNLGGSSHQSTALRS